MFTLPPEVEELSWDRDALWSAYPPDHIGRARGTSTKTFGHSPPAYRKRPQEPWALDVKDFYLHGKAGLPKVAAAVPNDFRAGRENIWSYTLTIPEKGAAVTVEGDGKVAARSEVLSDGSVRLVVNNAWYWPNLGWGNYEGEAVKPADRFFTVRLQLQAP